MSSQSPIADRAPRTACSPELRELLSRSDEELARCDLARTNLLAAGGLPSADSIDIDRCVRRLDEMAARVKACTNRGAFEKRPALWDNSYSIFRIHALISVLQREFGLRYNPAKIPEHVPLDVEDSFIHGALFGNGGTCASLPVVIAAVGRRLGYPLKLVAAAGKHYGHCFARWDEPGGERFNIEVNNEGFGCPDDDHYRSGRYWTKPHWEGSGGILKSQTPREELAGFMGVRGAKWLELGSFRGEVEALAWANELFPTHFFYFRRLKHVLLDWYDALKARVPPGFPPFTTHFGPRRFPQSLADDVERFWTKLIGIENLLNDPIHERELWDPMRRGLPMPRRPVHVTIHRQGETYHVKMHFSKSGLPFR
jgi:hypothetical protein